MVISVGLCLDYSIHVAQEFLLCAKKTGDDRAMEAVSRVGKAVFNGGFTTFLGMAILGMGPGKPFYGFASLFLCTAHTLLSASHCRWAHGRVCCAVIADMVALGLFHGLAVLPVVLSWAQPKSIAGVLSSHGEADKVAEPAKKP